ncbi:MAG: hypothetical protein AAGA72_11030 [Pseudomonadota bacterium]
MYFLYFGLYFCLLLSGFLGVLIIWSRLFGESRFLRKSIDSRAFDKSSAKQTFYYHKRSGDDVKNFIGEMQFVSGKVIIFTGNKTHKIDLKQYAAEVVGGTLGLAEMSEGNNEGQGVTE